MFERLPRPDLAWTPEIAAETAPVYEKVRTVIPAIEWPVYAPLVSAINRLKRQRGAVILAHNYQTPEIFHGVADIVGDSLQLAREATRAKGDVIIQCGVHFMAETSKILNMDKAVLIPDGEAGCSLAASITAADVRRLKALHPGAPVVAYVNTSADVKAEVDICCTSSNAVKVVESLGVPKVIMVPDEYLARNVAAKTRVEIVTFAGRCEVHERFTAEDVAAWKADDPDVTIIAHPECSPEVVAASDFAGSTAHMIDFVKRRKPRKALLVTECSMADNVTAEAPETTFVKPCNLCPHMKRITLEKILATLLDMSGEVTVDPAVADRARRSVERMIAVG
nr:quinolinate synthase NadA [Chthonobacter rhizosphaerae]